MRLGLTLLLFPPTFATALAIVRRLRRMPLGLAAPLALALVICWEGLVLPALSFAHLVRPDALVVAHALPILVTGLVLLRDSRRARAALAAEWRAVRHAFGMAFPPGVAVLIAVLALVVAISAAEYPPNTWDSMTYHLARVAHWVFHRSVLVFPTFIHKQSVFPPGAEYLVLVPQVLADSDRLANGVQLFCWTLAVLAAPPLARSFGAPRRAVWLAAVLTATLPMAVLQASSTQNDLVAAVMAVALVSALLPMLHARRRLRLRDALLLGIAAAAAWLVKATALIVVAPFALWAAWTAARSLGRSRPLRPGVALRVAIGFVLPPAALVGLEVIRRGPFGLRTEFSHSDAYLYPFAGEWGDRLLNSLRAVSGHLVLGTETLSSAVPSLGAPCTGGAGCGFDPLRAHEDLAGNPVQAAMFVLTTLALLVRRLRGSRRSGGAVLALLAGWLLLHALFRPNAWISRLQTPSFVLAAAALGAAPIVGDRTWGRATRVLVALAAATLGFGAALRNELRPPRLNPPDPAAAYYAALPALRPSHDRALAALRATGCRRLGVYFPGAADSEFGEAWDYPLTWRARLQGVKVLTVATSTAWPCLIYSTGEAPPSFPGGPRWVPIEPRIYVPSPPG